MFKFRWDREWLKKLKGDRKVKFFQKFENHWFREKECVYNSVILSHDTIKNCDESSPVFKRFVYS